MLKSMTGYGKGEAQGEGLSVGDREPALRLRTLVAPGEHRQGRRGADELPVARRRHGVGAGHEADIAGAPRVAPDRRARDVGPVTPGYRLRGVSRFDLLAPPGHASITVPRQPLISNLCALPAGPACARTQARAGVLGCCTV